MPVLGRTPVEQQMFMQMAREGGLDPGIGPLAVVQRAGAANLREMLRRQMSPLIIDKTDRGAGLWTPMIKTAITRFKKAVTGEPVNLVGHRTEAGPGGPVPGRGMFYALRPHDAVSYSEEGTKVARSGGSRGKSIAALKLKNPLVAANQVDVIEKLLSMDPPHKKVGESLLNSFEAANFEDNLELWYRRADKWIARAAKAKKHDSVLYKDTFEAVDLP